MEREDGRSAEACPVCGEHRLALLGYPHISTTGVQPFSELIGVTEPTADEPPGIGCLACGTQWPDVDAFRRAKQPRQRLRRRPRR